MSDKYDIERLDSLWEEGDDLVPLLIESFLSRESTVLKDLENAINDEDRKQTSFHAHSFKGMASNLGGLTLAKKCHTLELQAAKEPERTFDEFKNLYNEIINEKNDFIAFLDTYQKDKRNP